MPHRSEWAAARRQSNLLPVTLALNFDARAVTTLDLMLQPNSQPSIRVCLPSPPPMIPSAARMIGLRQTTVGAGSEAAARQRSEVMDRSNRGRHNRGRAHKLHAE